ncbi:MAG: hypothetical protein WDO19_30230 [Bacteroidota bacterium]
MDDKTILLTGDGRTDDILKALEEKELIEPGGTLHVNVIKLPHHGSKANIRENFFQRLTADHYVISADGSNDNPDKEVLDFIADNVLEGTLYLTNKTGKRELGEKIQAFLDKVEDSGSTLKVKFLIDEDPPFIINLGGKSYILILYKCHPKRQT